MFTPDREQVVGFVFIGAAVLILSMFIGFIIVSTIAPLNQVSYEYISESDLWECDEVRLAATLHLDKEVLLVTRETFPIDQYRVIGDINVGSVNGLRYHYFKAIDSDGFTYQVLISKYILSLRCIDGDLTDAGLNMDIYFFNSSCDEGVPELRTTIQLKELSK